MMQRVGSRLGRRGVVVTAALGLLMSVAASSAGAQNADDPGDLGIGMEVFNGGCASCHQLDGSGSAAGRSLIDIALEQPDRSIHIASVTNGKGNMPAYEGRLTEDEIDAAVSYLRLTFLSAEDAMEELPNTGVSAWLMLVGIVLVATGGAVVLAVEPAMRRVPVRLAKR